VNVEGFNYDDFKAIPENQEFLERAREAGLSNDHLSFLLGEYSQLIPALMQESQHLDNDACVTDMHSSWNGANMHFIRMPVSLPVAKISVAVTLTARPVPARIGFVYFAPKASLERFFFHGVAILF